MTTNTYLQNNQKDFHFKYKDKKDFADNFNQMIQEHRNNYDPYFVTFTFEDIKANYAYKDYGVFFHYMFQRFDNALVLNSTKYEKSPILILIPETNPAIHFHGILLIHKNTSIRFLKKCVSNITHVQTEEKNSFYMSLGAHYQLQNKIDCPYPNKYKNNAIQDALCNEYNQKVPMLDSYRIHYLSTKNDVERCCSYSCKHFTKSKFSCNDTIIHKKLKPTKYKPRHPDAEANV